VPSTTLSIAKRAMSVARFLLYGGWRGWSWYAPWGAVD